MKRSEVKEIIFQELTKEYDQKCEILAEEILTKLEEIGMLPPQNGTHLSIQGNEEPNYEWEEE